MFFSIVPLGKPAPGGWLALRRPPSREDRHGGARSFFLRRSEAVLEGVVGRAARRNERGRDQGAQDQIPTLAINRHSCFAKQINYSEVFQFDADFLFYWTEESWTVRTKEHICEFGRASTSSFTVTVVTVKRGENWLHEKGLFGFFC